MSYQTESPKGWTLAATFAEAGEWDTAINMIPESRPQRATNRFFEMFAAVAFAEGGMHDEALRIYRGGSKRSGSVVIDGLQEITAGKVHIRCGTIYCD